MKYYASLNLNDTDVCVTSKKPIWRKFLIGDKHKQWVYKDGGFWKVVDVDLFYHLTKIKVQEGKDGLKEIPQEKMKWILKL